MLPDSPVTPGRGTTPDSNGDVSSTSQENTVPVKLPDSAAQKADDGQQPELPRRGRGQSLFCMSGLTLLKFRSR